jgi:chromosome segregation ATPase
MRDVLTREQIETRIREHNAELEACDAQLAHYRAITSELAKERAALQKTLYRLRHCYVNSKTES